jgi:hypothetical protein
MKYLKNFNEELKPDTYRSAASKLSYYNKDIRSNTLYDYADEKEFGFYNLSTERYEYQSTYEFTDPKLMGIYITVSIYLYTGCSDVNSVLHSFNILEITSIYLFVVCVSSLSWHISII